MWLLLMTYFFIFPFFQFRVGRLTLLNKNRKNNQTTTKIRANTDEEEIHFTGGIQIPIQIPLMYE